MQLWRLNWDLDRHLRQYLQCCSIKLHCAISSNVSEQSGIVVGFLKKECVTFPKLWLGPTATHLLHYYIPNLLDKMQPFLSESSVPPFFFCLWPKLTACHLTIQIQYKTGNGLWMTLQWAKTLEICDYDRLKGNQWKCLHVFICMIHWSVIHLD